MQLKTVSITGFRSIAALLNVHLGEPTLITGQNDGGKTSFLYAIQFLLNAYAANDRDHTYSQAKLQELPTLEQMDGGTRVDAAVGGERSTAVAADCPREDSLVVEGVFGVSAAEREQLGVPSQVRLRRRHQIAGNPVFEIEKDIPEDVRLRDLGNLKLDELKRLSTEVGLPSSGLKSDIVERLEDYATQSPQTTEWVVATPAIVRALPEILVFSAESSVAAEDSIRRVLNATYKSHLQNEGIAGKLQEIEQQLDKLLADDVESIAEHVRRRCHDVGTITVQPNSSLSAGVRDAYIEVSSTSGQAIRLSEAGAGRSRRISLAVWEAAGELLSKQSDVVVVYDEPDTHLDYLHQRELMQVVLEQSSMPNTKVVVATHSMNLIDGVDIGDVLHFKLDNERTVVHTLRDDTQTGRHLSSIASSLGLRNTTLLHERLFVGVEGVTEMASLPILFRLATGKHLESCGIAIWACGNNEGAANFAEFLRTHNRNVVFLCDHDSVKKCPKVFSPEKLRARGFDPDVHALYVGNPNEIEDLFNDTVWARVANIVWPLPEGRQWRPEQFVEKRAGKFSDAVLEMLKTDSPSGPSSKDDVMRALALNLSVAELPPDLVDRFERLRQLAA